MDSDGGFVSVTIRAVVTFAKVLSERVYIGRSRKRWISAVRRPRAKLLRDVFVVSFGVACVYVRVCVRVCVSRANHGEITST